MEENVEKINYNGEEYELADLSEKGQYFVAQLKKLAAKIDDTKFSLDQYEVAYNTFTKLLGEEINPEAKTADEFVAG